MKKFLSHTFNAVALAAAIFVLDGATGHNIFDTDDGNNVVCDIDPFCRKLTENEIKLAKEVFGNTVDYRSVKVFSRPILFVHLFPNNNTASSSLGNIFLDSQIMRKSDLSEHYYTAGTFMHEMTHVWQYQNMGFLASTNKSYLDEKRLKDKLGEDYTRAALYRYNLDDFPRFETFGTEQQAAIVGDYQRKKDFINILQQPAQRCQELSKYEEKLKQVFPVKPFPKCNNSEPKLTS